MNCLLEARSYVAKRQGMWIAKTVDTIQHHNDEIKWEGHCRRCQKTAPILWG